MTALKRRPPLLIPVLSAANFTIGVGAFVVVGVLSPIAESLEMSAAGAALIMGVYAVAYAVGSPLIVSATGAVQRRTVLAGGLALFGAAAVLMALADTAGMLLFGRALAAFGAGVVSPVAAGVAAASSPPEERGRALAAAFLGLTLSQVVGVPVGAWVGHTYGWRVDFWIVAALSALSLAGVWRFVPADAPVQVSTLATLWRTITDWRAAAAISFTTAFVGASYIFFTYVAPSLQAGMGFGRDGVSLFLFITGLGAVAGALVAGRLADRIGAGRTLALLCLVNILVTPVFSLFPLPAPLVFAAGFIWSAFGWSFTAVQQLRLIAIAPDRSNVMLSLNAAALYVGISVGSALAAFIYARFGYDGLGWGASAFMVVALANLLIVDRLLARRG